MHDFDGFHHHGHFWGGGPPPGEPSILLSLLGTMFWVALFVGIAWALLHWVLPRLQPTLTGFFRSDGPAGLAPLEILRRRYAAGEIDAETFEQMRERIEASYHPPFYQQQYQQYRPPQRDFMPREE